MRAGCTHAYLAGDNVNVKGLHRVGGPRVRVCLEVQQQLPNVVPGTNQDSTFDFRYSNRGTRHAAVLLAFNDCSVEVTRICCKGDLANTITHIRDTASPQCVSLHYDGTIHTRVVFSLHTYYVS